VGTRILSLMVQLLITPLQTPAMSAFSRLKNENKPIGPAYIRVTKLCSLLACPIFFGASAVAPDFVHIVFGPKWEDAGWIMAINGLAVGPSVIMYLFIPALASAGRSGLSLRHYVAALFTNVIVAALAIPFGLLAIASGKTIESHATLPYGLNLLKRGLGAKPAGVLSAIAPAYLAALIMAGTVAALGHFELQGMDPIARMLIMVASGGVLYVAILAIAARRFLAENINEFSPLLKELQGRLPRARKSAQDQN
jgi:O-antigen/teichoic acid export membrane protein